jgi:hypothetical protein
MKMKRRLFTSMLAMNHATSIASAFISSEVGLTRALLFTSTSPGRRRCIGKKTPLQMNYKSPDEINSYNDDAFGLVFLTGGVLSQDVDFVASFAALSAIAAIGTNVGLVAKDERAPAAVAMLTLLITPVISSLRQSGSLEQLASPVPVEIGLCSISAVWAFVNWSRAK